MPSLSSEDSEMDSELFLVVAHADGSIDIWWIFTCSETKKLVGEIMCSKNVFPGKIVSAMKVQRLDKNLGVLAVGTNTGIVKIFRVERQLDEAMEMDEEGEANGVEQRKFVYSISDGIEIWPEDSLSIESFMCSMLPPEERNILKRINVDILFLKHPYHLCSSSVSVFADGLVWEAVEHVKIPEGPVVGKSKSLSLYLL